VTRALKICALVALLGLAAQGCEHLRSKDASADANADQTAKSPVKSTVPNSDPYLGDSTQQKEQPAFAVTTHGTLCLEILAATVREV
jgi:hypothetical protein